jgi:hypothetical protein
MAPILIDKTILVLKKYLSHITTKALRTLILRPCNERIDCLQSGREETLGCLSL